MPKRMFVVTYDISATTNAETRKAISDAIEASGNWWHHLGSTWLVVSEKNANEIEKMIDPHVRKAPGRLLVMEVVPSNRQGLLPKKGWDWIRTWAARLRETG